MKPNKCNCTMAISMLGDGCRYCQPQEYIDQMHEGIDEDRAELDKANARIAQLEAVLVDANERSKLYSTHKGRYSAFLQEMPDTWLLDHDKDVEVRVLEEALSVFGKRGEGYEMFT